MNPRSAAQDGLKRFSKVVIWGLRHQQRFNSFRFIHQHFYDTLRKLDIEVVWCDDTPANGHVVGAGDLVMAVGFMSEHLPIRDDAYYCLHNFEGDIYEKIAPSRCVKLQVYTTEVEQRGEAWDAVTYFDRRDGFLYQPWGTDLLPDEFMAPVFPGHSKLTFWIGSIWNNEQNQGNLNEVEALRKAAAGHGVRFISPGRLLPNALKPVLIRQSRIAPAIGGAWQAQVNYMPCRMFKNISYGQLGITNVRKFSDLLGPSFLEGDSVEELVDNAMALSRSEFLERTRAQQEAIRQQTYASKLANIARALAEVART